MEALELVARAYWKPLYRFARQRGAIHEEACDQVQGFFAHLLARDFLDGLDAAHGRFRNFLLVSFRRWLRDQGAREQASKRGGGRPPGSLEELEECGKEPIDPAGDPEAAFELQWARTLFERALRHLAEDWKNRPELYQALRSHLDCDPATGDYGVIAARLGLSVGAVRKAAFDLRRDFGAHLRREVRSTVVEAWEAEDELRHLVTLLRGR